MQICVDALNDSYYELLTELGKESSEEYSVALQLPPGGLQQLIFDFHIYKLYMESQGASRRLGNPFTVLLEQFCKSRSISAEILQFSPEIYSELYSSLDLS